MNIVFVRSIIPSHHSVRDALCFGRSLGIIWLAKRILETFLFHCGTVRDSFDCFFILKLTLFAGEPAFPRTNSLRPAPRCIYFFLLIQSHTRLLCKQRSNNLFHIIAIGAAGEFFHNGPGKLTYTGLVGYTELRHLGARNFFDLIL